MAKYIEREAAVTFLRDHSQWLMDGDFADGVFTASEMLERVPAADVAPVVHGEWVVSLYTTTSKRGRVISNAKFACSECGYGNGRKPSNFCPNCGADMRERKGDDAAD